MSEIDDYLERVPAQMRKVLSDLRGAIASAAPQATETMSYQMPARLRYGGNTS